MRKTYRKLDVWHKAMELAEAVYALAAKFPAEEKYGLKSQIQRAAVSVPANIAEGYGRAARGDYIQHLAIARGSLHELETHLALAVRLKLANRSAALPVWELAEEVGAMLTRLMLSLRPSAPNPRPSTRVPPRAK